MNIEEALELLEAYLLPKYPCHFNDFDDAVMLGIDALKRIEAIRNPRLYKIGYLLPGETNS